MDSWPTWIREGGLGGFKSWLLTTPTQPQSLLPNAGKDWDPLIPALEGTVSQTPPPPNHSNCSTFIWRLQWDIWAAENKKTDRRMAGSSSRLKLSFAGRDSHLVGHPGTPTGQSWAWLNALFVFGKPLVPVKSD